MSSTELVEVATSADVAGAETSTAEGDKGSVLDAVRASLKPTEESPSSETGKETVEAEPVDKTDAVGDKPDEEYQLSPEETKALSKRSQDRFRDLVTRSKTAEAKATGLAPRAEQFDRIVEHNRQHGISAAEFNNAIELLRISKTDKNRAFDLVSGVLQNLAQQTGRALDPALQERIRLGHISEPEARRLSQAEASAKLATERETTARETAEQERTERAWGEQVTTATNAVDAWAKAEATSDPEWSLKMPHMQRALELELQRGGPAGYPKTAKDAVALAEKVKKQVTKDLKAFQQPKPAIVPTNSEGSSSRNAAEPTSAVEAARVALAKM